MHLKYYIHTVLYPVRPLVHVPVQKVSASPGRRVQLECNVEAFPRAEVTWEWRGERGAPPTRIESDSKCEDGTMRMRRHSNHSICSGTRRRSFC